MDDAATFDGPIAATEHGPRVAEPCGEFPPPRPLARRLADAVRRRADYAWRRWTWGNRPPAVEAAFDWLAAHRDGVPANAGEGPCPAATGAAIEAAAAYGADDLVVRWREGLLAAQQPDGGFLRSGRTASSCRHTGYALRGSIVAEDVLPSVESRSAIGRAAVALADRLAALDDPPATALPCLPPLRAASKVCGFPRGERVAVEAFRRLRRTLDLARWDVPLEEHAARLEALWELRDLTDGDALARLLEEALALPAACQRPDGGVPDRPGGKWISSAGVARLALLWLRVGERDRAGRALDYLATRVPRPCRPCGDDVWVPRLSQPCGVELAERRIESGNRSPATDSAWTAIWFLLASRLRVASAFDGEAPNSAAIDPADGRWLAVESLLRGLPPGARVADVGCGDGRYLRRMRERFPRLRLVGIDPSAAALAAVPEEIEIRRGDLLRLPAGDGEFDAAVCVEALEHALLPRRAVAELCRVVRPGGQVVLVDKNAALQALSHRDPWERWFTPGEVAGWLAEHCHAATARHIPHGTPPRDPRLFFAWTAERREHSNAPPSMAQFAQNNTLPS